MKYENSPRTFAIFKCVKFIFYSYKNRDNCLVRLARDVDSIRKCTDLPIDEELIKKYNSSHFDIMDETLNGVVTDGLTLRDLHVLKASYNRNVAMTLASIGEYGLFRNNIGSELNSTTDSETSAFHEDAKKMYDEILSVSNNIKKQINCRDNISRIYESDTFVNNVLIAVVVNSIAAKYNLPAVYNISDYCMLGFLNVLRKNIILYFIMNNPSKSYLEFLSGVNTTPDINISQSSDIGFICNLFSALKQSLYKDGVELWMFRTETDIANHVIMDRFEKFCLYVAQKCNNVDIDLESIKAILGVTVRTPEFLSIKNTNTQSFQSSIRFSNALHFSKNYIDVTFRKSIEDIHKDPMRSDMYMNSLDSNFWSHYGFINAMDRLTGHINRGLSEPTKEHYPPVVQTALNKHDSLYNNMLAVCIDERISGRAFSDTASRYMIDRHILAIENSKTFSSTDKCKIDNIRLFGNHIPILAMAIYKHVLTKIEDTCLTDLYNYQIMSEYRLQYTPFQKYQKDKMIPIGVLIGDDSKCELSNSLDLNAFARGCMSEIIRRATVDLSFRTANEKYTKIVRYIADAIVNNSIGAEYVISHILLTNNIDFYKAFGIKTLNTLSYNASDKLTMLTDIVKEILKIIPNNNPIYNIFKNPIVTLDNYFESEDSNYSSENVELIRSYTETIAFFGILQYIQIIQELISSRSIKTPHTMLNGFDPRNYIVSKSDSSASNLNSSMEDITNAVTIFESFIQERTGEDKWFNNNGY